MKLYKNMLNNVYIEIEIHDYHMNKNLLAFLVDIM